MKKLFKKVVNVVKKVVKKVVNFVKDNIKTIVAIAVVVAAPYALGMAISSTSALAGSLVGGLNATGLVVAGAIGGGLSGLITTGSLKGALIGAATGAALAGIGNHFGAMAAKQVSAIKPHALNLMKNGLTHAQFAAKSVAHGLVGGLRGKLSGGSFSKSFVSMGFTQLAAPGIDQIGGKGLAGSSARIVAGGLVGGTAATIAGGKFKDGFESGILSRGLNDELDSIRSIYRATQEGVIGAVGSSILAAKQLMCFSGLMGVNEMYQAWNDAYSTYRALSFAVNNPETAYGLYSLANDSGDKLSDVVTKGMITASTGMLIGGFPGATVSTAVSQLSFVDWVSNNSYWLMPSVTLLEAVDGLPFVDLP